MANSTPARDAALQAQDKRLLTRDWVNSNSRNSKHLRSSSSWNPPRAWIGSKTTARKTDDYHKDECKNAGVKVCFKLFPLCDNLATGATPC